MIRTPTCACWLTRWMGHEVPGMRGVYKHIAPEWRVDLVTGLERLWEESLDNRLKISAPSAVPLLDGFLAARRNQRALSVR
jgi:hypothetical protein